MNNYRRITLNTVISFVYGKVCNMVEIPETATTMHGVKIHLIKDSNALDGIISYCGNQAWFFQGKQLEESHLDDICLGCLKNWTRTLPDGK